MKNKVKLITERPSDLKVVNTARVSMAKKHTEFDVKGDTGLLNYLARHRHWTPFGHIRDTIVFDLKTEESFNRFNEFLLYSLSTDERTYMSISPVGTVKVAIKLSLFGWVNFIDRICNDTILANDIKDELIELIINVMYAKYPVSAAAYKLDSIYIPLSDTAKLIYKQNLEEVNKYIDIFNDDMFDITLYQSVPIFTSRQVFKHIVEFVYNEVSRRYVDEEPTMFEVDAYRSRPEKSIKQGSGGVHPESDVIKEMVKKYHEYTVNTYNTLIKEKVAPEQVRGLLPQDMMTEYYVTGSVKAWRRVLKQRLDSHAQKEVQDLAQKIESEIGHNINFEMKRILASDSKTKYEELLELGIF